MTDWGSRRVNSPSLPALLPPGDGLQGQGGVSVQWPSRVSVLDGKAGPPSPKKHPEAPVLSADHFCHISVRNSIIPVSLTKA